MSTRKNKGLVCYHFAGTTLRDGRALPKAGAVTRHEGDVVPCESGLHGSVRAIDALKYAPGLMVARVRLSGTIVPHEEDKHAASVRTNLTDYVDAKPVIVALCRVWALRAVRVHAANGMDKAGLTEQAAKLRALPDDCTLVNLENAAWAAGDAAGDAAWDAARAAWAAREAARAAREAAWDAARAAWAAREAARAARAARDAARDAAGAAWAARDAARDAAGDAAWAAWDAETQTQNSELEAALAKLGV